ncbi:hypothetical protein NE562_14085 [Butyricicoccus faecihominis]|uniref:hypothetical protein n=1 Tax=Butyricicoccaceae TaxID=3085642 RepID=UPI0024783878|nr:MULTISPECIES: hypothetical protein [Butyricicoccaceae]MCQ5130794.1 hypothetical protein [Butyricicoccus faecihominis]WNX85196.1 hypothetical protein RWV98_02660 [Agathobaculum sp. NTUH-O15-33]
MDFSTEFIALRDRLRAGQDAKFESTENMSLLGRMAALYSTFSLKEERKILGIMPTGGTSHAHEYRALFAAPTLDETGLNDWWEYAKQLENDLVEADLSHEFSIISLILVAEQLDRTVQKKLKRLGQERHYDKPQNGWSTIRFAVVELPARKIHTNRMGEPLKNILKPLL